MPGKQFSEARVLSCEFRASDTEGVITGRAVPFGRWTPINGTYLERITADTFRESVTRGEAAQIPLLLDHENHSKSLVGKPLQWRIEDDGLHADWQIDVGGEAGGEAWRLAREGFLRGMSVGFQPGDADDIDLEGDVPRVTRGPAVLREVSLVPAGAYQEAQVLSVRTAGLRRGPDPRIAAYRAALGLVEEASS